MEKIKALVIDDTVVYRKIVSDVLKEIPGVEVTGVAHNGKIALSKINSLKPDIITLDIEMPEINGIEVLEKLREMPEPPVVIMLSTLTREGGEMTIKALELGALDFIPKPDEGSMAENMKKVNDALRPMIDLLKRERLTRAKIREKISRPRKHPVPEKSEAPPIVRKRDRKTLSEIVGIGISTGGPNALNKMVPMLPENINVPILIVQHMPPLFTASLAGSLNRKSRLTVTEAQNGDILTPGTIYIAPGGMQMKIISGADGITRKIKITDDPPENSCKPSVDYLFKSLAQYYVGRATGVIMTGMGSDGTKGLGMMKESGSFIIAQDEASCTVYGMPKGPIESGTVDVIAPLDKIAEEIAKTVLQ